MKFFSHTYTWNSMKIMMKDGFIMGTKRTKTKFPNNMNESRLSSNLPCSLLGAIFYYP